MLGPPKVVPGNNVGPGNKVGSGELLKPAPVTCEDALGINRMLTYMYIYIYEFHCRYITTTRLLIILIITVVNSG